MAQMNYDLITKLDRVIPVMEEDVIGGIQKGVAATKEVCVETGSEKLKKSAETTEAASQELVAAAKELVEVLSRLKEQYKKAQNVLQ